MLHQLVALRELLNDGPELIERFDETEWVIEITET